MGEAATNRLSGHPRYLRLLSATGISSIGDGIFFVGLPLVARAANVTTSSRSIAGIFAVSRLPLLFMSFGGAAIADRSDARKTMVVADLVRAGVLISLGAAAIADSLSLAAIYVAAFVLGLFEIPFAAASQRMIPTTVPDELLPRANARMQSAQISGEQFVGPAIGGQLASVGGGVHAWPILGDAASFLMSAAFLRGLPPQPPEVSAADRRSIRSDIREGIDWFRSNATLRIATAMFGLMAFAQAMVNALLVQLAQETLGLSGRATGFFIAAIAVGNVVGTLLAERVLRRLGYGGCLLTMVVFAGFGYGALGFTRNASVVIGFMILEGIVIMFGQVAFNVLRQRLIPRAMIGRVYTTTRIFIRGAAPFGALLGGEIAERNGPPAAMLTAGVLAMLIAVALGPRLLTGLRNIHP